jgi:hypothetical protein
VFITDTPGGVAVIPGLVTPSDGEYCVEGCSVVHPVATRSATRNMLPIRNILAGDMWNQVVPGEKNRFLVKIMRLCDERFHCKGASKMREWNDTSAQNAPRSFF